MDTMLYPMNTMLYPMDALMDAHWMLYNPIDSRGGARRDPFPSLLLAGKG